MTTLSLDKIFAAELVGASVALEAGVHVVLGSPSDGTAALVSLVAGTARKKRGTLTLNGEDPFRTPGLRRRVGALLAEEPAVEDATVARHVAAALALRGDAQNADGVLAAFGLQTMAARRPARLSAGERRAVALALALSHAQPLALALHEPLANVAIIPRRTVVEAIASAAARGAVVLCATASPRDAAELGGGVVLLDRGRFVRRPGLPLAAELAPGAGLTLALRTESPRPLAAALSNEDAVAGVELDEHAHPGQLRASGPDADALALAVLRAAQSSGAVIDAIEPVLPSVDDARAATAALWRAAYENAYRAARAPKAEGGAA